MTNKSKLILELTKVYNDRRCSDYKEPLKAVLDMLESGIKELTTAFEELTNGEVIIALFPNADYEGGAHFMHITNVNSIGEISIPWEWWNAPYKAESEGEVMSYLSGLMFGLVVSLVLYLILTDE